jgi:predicted CoA-binding protein
MSAWTAGDFLFITLVLLLILGIMLLANRSRRIRPANFPAVPDPGAGDTLLRSILAESRTIAVVGVAADPESYSHRVCRYLQDAGYTVFPVRPDAAPVLGRPSYSDLAAVPEVPDLVDVFLPPEAAPEAARGAVARGAKVLWLQEGVITPEGMKIARQGGMAVVMDHCMMKEHRRLIGLTQLG